MEPINQLLVMPDKNFRFKSCVTSKMIPMIEVHPHWHSEIEMLYFISGNARQQINEKSFIAETGDIVIINQGQVHSTYSYGGSQIEILVIQFDAFQFFPFFTEQKDQSLNQVFGSWNMFNNPIKSSEPVGEIILSCMEEIHRENTNKELSFQYIINSLISRLIGLSIRYGLFQEYKNEGQLIQKAKKMLYKTFAFIDEYYTEDINLNKAALYSNFSVSHFCRLFKRATGMTFNDYLAFYRVNRAESMMNSNKKIADIAMECGFGSMSSFIRSYKRWKNCTPSCFKKQECPNFDGE